MRFWQRQMLLTLCSISYITGASANVTFSGILKAPPPCTIDGGTAIEVDFKEVGIRRIDGVNYREIVNYTITCSPDALPWEMRLSVIGTPTVFEPSAIQSSVADLGIQLFQNGVPFDLNTRLPINPLTPPTLEAVPIKEPGSTLAPGGFTATATLLAEYQ